MSKDNSGQLRQDYFLPCFIFALMGLLLHPVFFIVSLCCLISGMANRKQKIMVSVLASVLLIVAFAYGIGKDMALRDNQAVEVSK